MALSTYRLTQRVPRRASRRKAGVPVAVLACAGLWAGGWTLMPVGRSCARWWALAAGHGYLTRVGAVWYTRAPACPRARARVLIRHKSGVGDWIINKVEFILDTRKFLQNFAKNFTNTYSLPWTENRTKAEDCSY